MRPQCGCRPRRPAKKTLIGTAVAQAENIAFEQMAAQGQSMFAASGDQGTFDCLLTDGTSVVNVDDPESQPWVTSVGGTSFETFNPGQNPRPGYPAAGTETVWNVDNLCNADPDENGADGFFWCSEPGATGGGSSEFWGRPAYQHGPGGPPIQLGCPELAPAPA